MGYVDYNGKRYCRGNSSAKALGEPQQCSAEGNPINSATGNKYQRETDYAGAGGPLVFERHYNSIAYPAYASDQFTAIGKLWRHTYDRWITESVSTSLTTANVYRADGKIFAFNLYNGGYYGDRDVQSKLSRVYVNGTPVGWKYIEQTDDSEETYNNEGRLTGIKFRSGITLSLTYASSRLGTIVDSFGRQISLSYDAAGRIGGMTDPAGAQYLYEYAANGNLIKVIYPDGRGREYVYDAAGQPHALSGIIDENQSRYATYGYTSGMANLSEHAGGAGRVTLSYDLYNPLTVVTDSLGTSRQHLFSTIAGIPRKVSVSQPCASCGSASSIGYDANGNIRSVLDFNGNRTCREYDLARNLETTRVEGFASGSVCPASLSSYIPAAGTKQRKITTQWHATYRLPTQIDEPGKRTTYLHDAWGNVLTQTVLDTNSSESRTRSYAYNSLGQVITADGPRTDVSDVTTYTYYSCATGAQCGQIQTITNALGHTTTYNIYNAHGQPLTITDGNGVVTTLTYDLRQRLTSRTIGGEQTSFEYWPTGLLKKATLPDGSYLAYTYDAAHRLTDINDAENHRIHYTLDAMGNRTKEELFDPTNVLTLTRTRVFNTLSQLWKEIGASGGANVTTTYGYDSNGNQTTVAAPLGRGTTNVYDELNRLRTITDPASGLTTYGYDALDQLISVTDPRNLTTSYTYNALGDLKTQTSPDTGVTSSTYDSGGNLATSTDARNAVSTYTYDALNRVATASFATGSTTDPMLTYAYDVGTHGKGRRTGVSDSNHSLSWTYDAQGRVLTAGQTVGSVSKTTSYSYASGRRQSMTTPSGQVITYGYTQGKITSVSVNGTPLVSNILYEPFGPVRQWTWANGALAVRTFDQDGKVTQIDSEVLKTYSYDDAFRITGITDASNAALSWTYGYDGLDRLISASRTGTTLGYSYDANGNRLTQTGANASTFTIAANSNRLSSTSGALTRAYGYDNAGNVTSFTGLTFAYDNRGRMSSSTKNGVTTSYVYNALGQLIKKGTNTLYYYDEAGHVLGTYSGSGALVEEIVWLGDIPIISLRPRATGGINIYNIHTDHLNAPRLITGSVNPGIRWRWDAEPFGDGTVNNNPSGAGAFEFHLRFPGQIYFVETGLNYNYYRDYDPSTGRYAQSDPIGLKGGINTYAYVLNNPLLFSDPLGLDAAMCRAALRAAGGVVGGATGAACGCVLAGALGGAGGTVLGPGGTVAGAVGGCGAGGDIGGVAGAALGGLAGDKLADSVCKDEPDCSKATPWQLMRAGILDEHDFKDEYHARPNSRYDICACKDGSIVIKAVGACGKPGPGIPTFERWK